MKKNLPMLSTLEEWLWWIAKVNPKQMDLTLVRVQAIAAQLQLLPLNAPVVVVGGTNGKGSTVAGLESIYRAAGFKTGAFTSPYLQYFNEQIKVANVPTPDKALIKAFTKIESVRGDITLTPFEFTTLVALLIFKNENVDVYLLEVGLGGRLDAVNIVDADLTIITSIALDHTDWLGQTREEIGYEKAGIFREGCPIICGDEDPPQSIVQKAHALNAPLFMQGQDFSFECTDNDWQWKSAAIHYDHLPKANLLYQNLATVLMAITKLQDRLPVTLAAIKQGFNQLSLPGRIEHKLNLNETSEIYDVAHNPAAITKLMEFLQDNPIKGNTYAVFSMLRDKDILECIKIIAPEIHTWFVAPLQNERSANVVDLQTAFLAAQIKNFIMFTTIKDAYHQAYELATKQDRIIIFGSFYTVGAILKT